VHELLLQPIINAAMSSTASYSPNAATTTTTTPAAATPNNPLQAHIASKQQHNKSPGMSST
jgi:hypothetical protein